MNYDPDRSLWLPSRRKFFFLGLAAGVAPFLPDVPHCVLVPQHNPDSAWQQVGAEWSGDAHVFSGETWIRLPNGARAVTVFEDGVKINEVPIHVPRGSRLILDSRKQPHQVTVLYGA